MNARKLTLLITFALVAMTFTPGTTVSADHAPTAVTPSSGNLNGGIQVELRSGGGDIFAGITTPSETEVSVSFGGTAADIEIVGDKLFARVPPKSTTGAVNVVTTVGGHSVTITNGFTYTATSTPTITSLSLTSATTNGDVSTTITGTGFHAGVDNSAGAVTDGPPATVRIGGVIAPVTAASTTSLTVTVPANSEGAKDVVVTNPDGKSATKTGGFTYVAAAAPDVTGVSPNTANENGDVGGPVTISGSGFAQGVTVRIGGKIVPVSVNTATSITLLDADIPGNSAGVKDVEVFNPDGQSDLFSSGFVYTNAAAPTVTTISPDEGSVSGGNTVTITGTNFHADATVTIGGNAATEVVRNSATELTAVVPAHAAGEVSVTVTNPSGKSATLSDSYEFRTDVKITGISPSSTSTKGDVSVSLSGTGFQSGAKVYLLNAGGTPVAFDVDLDNVVDDTAIPTSGSGTSLTFKTPPCDQTAGGGGTCDSTTSLPRSFTVMVRNPDGTEARLTDGLTYTAATAPTITAPGSQHATADSNGGATISLAGTGFAPGARVFIEGAGAGTPATDVEADLTQTPTATLIRFKAPPCAAADGEPCAGGGAATFPIRVDLPNGQSATLAGGLEYTARAAAPSLASLDVTSGSENGGTTVKLTGTGYHTGNNKDLVMVTFGGTPARSVTTTATVATTVTPTHGLGAVDVIITNPDGRAATLVGAYTYTAAADPTLSGSPISPSSGTQLGGTTVTLTGTNFHPFKDFITVKVDGIEAEVTSATATQVRFVTPGHATGTATIELANPTGTPVSTSFTFTDAADPVITSVSPSGDNIAGGTEVTLTGSNFAFDHDNDDDTCGQVRFGGTAATSCEVVSTTQIKAVAPPKPAGASTIVVTNPGGDNGAIVGAFTYHKDGPRILMITPTEGLSNGGATVEICADLPGSPTIHSVLFGNTPGTAISTPVAPGVASTCFVVFGGTHTFTVDAPAQPAGDVNVFVIDPEGQTGTFEEFTYGAAGAPIVEVTGDFSPTSGPTSGGTAITITGINFFDGATVSIGGSAATDVTFVSGTELTAITPGHAAGAVSIEVTNPDGTSGSLQNAFTYLGAGGPEAPSISNLSPNTGDDDGGYTVTINGANFQSGATLTVDGVDVDVTYVSSSQLTYEAPAHTVAAGASEEVDVVVTNPDDQDATATFTYTNLVPPVFTSFTPTSGSSLGGTEVTITGENFVDGATVTFGGTAGTVEFVSATELTVTTPAHAPGLVDVVVTNPDSQSATADDQFDYEAADPPSLTSIAPDEGPSTGGTEVTLTGTNFAEGATVRFGSAAATGVTFVSATELTATSPAGSGTVDVTVTNPDDQADTLDGVFTYIGPAIPNESTISTANTNVQATVKVTSTSNGNQVSWDPSAVHADAAGVQIWRIDSPAVWVTDVQRGTAAFTSGELLDTAGSETSKYLVTVYWNVGGVMYGYSQDAITDLPGYTGLSEQQVEDRASGVDSGGLLSEWWFWLLISVGVLVLILLIVLGVVLSRRGEKEQASEWEEDDDLGWADDEGVDLADDEFAGEEGGFEDEPWEEGAAAGAAATHAEEVHTLECPNCQTQFTASGSKPIVTTCPGCGKRGILR